MTNKSKRLVWRGCIAGVFALLVVSYSPLILTVGVVEPWLFGLPRSLWATLLSAFGIVGLTAIGAAAQTGSDDVSGSAAQQSNDQKPRNTHP